MIIALALGNRQSVYDFMDHSDQMAVGMSNPSIMFKGRLNDGREIIVDDYREVCLD